MASKRKANDRVANPHQQSTETLLEQTTVHLQAERFREALEGYKLLLKREDRQEWRTAMGEAYIGRARQLAAKAMHKEAAALWENMAKVCGERDVDLYMQWLIQAGRIEQGVRLFAQADARFRNSPSGQAVATHLAVELLCGQHDVLTYLPADSPLRLERDTVLAAMQAYCDGDVEALQAHLQTISFRSPYRELRVVLQALALMDTDVKAAQDALQRVPTDSPLAQLAGLIRLIPLEGEALLTAMQPLPMTARELLLTLKGWAGKRIESIKQLPDIHLSSKPHEQLHFILRHANVLDPQHLRSFCLSVLPHCPASMAAVTKRLGHLDAFEKARIRALAAEIDEEPCLARKYWGDCIAALPAPPPKVGSDAALEIALIHRHIFELRQQCHDCRQMDDGWDDLVASLQLDPQDKPTYLRLVALAEKRNDTKTQDYWVEQAVQHFPEDADILMAAGKAAYRRQSFKKAVGFAGQLLQRDPINASAKDLIIESHLGHARKQAKIKRYDLAERELHAALNHAQNAERRGMVILVQGLIQQHQGNNTLAMDSLRHSFPLLSSSNTLLATFIFFTEGFRLGITPQALKQALSALQTPQPELSPADVMQVIAKLESYLDIRVKILPDVIEILRAPLLKASQLKFSEAEFTTLCETFCAVPVYGMLEGYAAVARRRFSGNPRFIYYSVFGSTRGNTDMLNQRLFKTLDQAINMALDQNDLATAEMIERFLYPHRHRHPLRDLPFQAPQAFPGQDEPWLMDAVKDLEEFLLQFDDPEEALAAMEETLRKSNLNIFPNERPTKRRRR